MTVRALKFEPEGDVIPHAIIWRPLKSCTLISRDSEDDLDQYSGASFSIGNGIIFDLRVYRGHMHSAVTVTLYLPEGIHEENRISEMVSTIVNEMEIPASAVAWQRGQEFRFGKIERSPQDRLREREARVLVLKIAASQPTRSISIGKLREQIPMYFDLTPEDNKPSRSRTNEVSWQIVLRNTISSHTTGTRTIFAQGWAEKIPGGIKLTRRGLDYLNSIGFSDFTEADLRELE